MHSRKDMDDEGHLAADSFESLLLNPRRVASWVVACRNHKQDFTSPLTVFDAV